MNNSTPTDFVSQLCPNCGLCCNGVLFADVELRKDDNASQLAGLGLSLKKKGRRQAFTQPCACFDGKLCRIYSERPRYCQAFECGLLKKVQAGELEVETALKSIAEARRRVGKVAKILRRLGQHDEQLALIKRHVQVMSEAVDLSGPKAAVAWRGELMLAVEDLMRLLQRDFLK